MKEFINMIKKNRLVNSFIVLLTGEGIVSIMGIVSLAVIVRTIGLEANGIILSLQVYCQLMNNIFGFRSFQALIKFITVALENKDYNSAEKYIYQSYLLDIIATIMSTLCGFIFLGLYSKFMNWDSALIGYCKIFLIAYLFQIQGAPIGVLRVFNKFNFITYNNVTIGFVKFICYLIGFVFGGGLNYFMIVEIILTILPNIILNLLCFKILKENKLEKFYKCKFNIEKEFFMFNFYSNIVSTIDIPVGTLTSIFINKYLGYADISIYKVFEKLSGLISKLGSPLNQIIYPELNRHIAQKNYKKAKQVTDKLVIYITLLGSCIIVGVYLTYPLWLSAFIPNYDGYITALLLYFAFVIFANATSSIHSLFMALNYIKFNMPILIIVNSIYLVLIYILINKIGLSGLICALFIQAIVIVVIKIIIMRTNNYKEYKNV